MTDRRQNPLLLDLLDRCCRQLWGFTPAVITGVVSDKGALGSLAWFAANLPRFLISMRRLGPVRTHLACAAISLHNRCGYCAHGQLYALELIHLRDTGQLFPLDVQELPGWLQLDRRQLGTRLRAVLRAAGWQAEETWVELALAFAAGDQQPIDDDEVRLAHLVRMVGEMNRIAIAIGAVPDGAQDPVNKDAELKSRHAALRLATTTATGS